jgi:hypothetical protein
MAREGERKDRKKTKVNAMNSMNGSRQVQNRQSIHQMQNE